MSKIGDKELTELLRDPASRRRAFAVMVDTYSQPLYWHIRRLVTYHDDADDVLQNTFVKAWNGLDGFRGESKLQTWLYRIAYNESVTFLQQQHQHLSLDAAYGAEDSDDSDNGSRLAETLVADPYFDGDETDALLQQSLQTLPPKQRNVFCMKYFQDMKYEDIATATGTSIGALKASYHIAVKKIEAFFNAHD